MNNSISIGASTGTPTDISFEDEEEHENVTVDELLSSVLQTKSLLRDRVRYTLPVRGSRYEKNDATPSITKITGNLSDPSSRKAKFSSCTPKDGDKWASLQKNKILTRTDTQPQKLPQSKSKISRSVSTPEINFKFMDAPPPKKSEAHRKVDFSHIDAGKQKNAVKCSVLEGKTQVNNIFLKESVFEHERNPSSTYGPDKHHLSELNDTNELEIIKSSSLSNIYMPRYNTGGLNSYKRYATPLSDRLKSNENVEQNSILPCPRLLAEGEQPKILTRHLNSNKENLVCMKTLTVKDSSRNTNYLQENRYLEPALHSSLFKTPTSRVSPSRPSHAQSAPSPVLSLGTSDIIVVNGLNYLKQKEFGKGGSSVVYEVWDLKARQRKAIKIVNLDQEDEATRSSYKNEIEILKRLQYSNRVIKFYDYEESANQLKIVIEAGDIDLATILSEARRNKTTPISTFSVKHYWQGMLLAVQVIHDQGIIHSDLKPANFLLVNGTLKLIDFGIASSVQQDMTSVLKDSQSGTYNYMSPESLNDIYSGPIINGKVQDKATIKISVKSDVWSLGCILYNLVYGKTPFQHIMNPLQKLGAISNAKSIIAFPPVTDKHLLDVMQKCLQFVPKMRPSIQSLLKHPYLEGSLTLSSENLSKVQSPLDQDLRNRSKALS